MAEPATGTVAVTGASGFIGSTLVKLLLQRGYTVRAAVRDPGDVEKTAHLRALAGAGERLQLVRANLLEEGSFDTTVDGCECVFHVALAAPFPGHTGDPQTDFVDPAVTGTLNVLRSCAKTPSVKRVVLTSSMATVVLNEKPLASDVVVDETWHSTAEVCEQNGMHYELAKLLSEEAASRFAAENGVDMVIMNPGLVLGPLLQPRVNDSVDLIFSRVIHGFPIITVPVVNVEDVAMAHVLAYEQPSAKGRYCIAERVAHTSDFVRIVRELYPSMELPPPAAPEECGDEDGKKLFMPLMPVFQVSKEKVKSLGLEMIPLEVTIKQTFESLREKGFF